MCETTSWQKICKISSLTMAKLQNLLSGFLCVSFPNGKKTEKKTPSSYEGDDAPVEAGTHVNAFLLADLGKRAFNALISKSSLNCFINSNHLNLKMNWDVRCPKLYQLLNGSKVLRVAPAWPGKKKTGSEGCVEARKDFVCWKYTPES